MVDEDEPVAVADAPRRAELPPPRHRLRRQAVAHPRLLALPHDALVVGRLGRLDAERRGQREIVEAVQQLLALHVVDLLEAGAAAGLDQEEERPERERKLGDAGGHRLEVLERPPADRRVDLQRQSRSIAASMIRMVQPYEPRTPRNASCSSGVGPSRLTATRESPASFSAASFAGVAAAVPLGVSATVRPVPAA